MSGSAEVARSSTDDDEGAAAASGDPLVGGAVGRAVGPGRTTGEGGVRACKACDVIATCLACKSGSSLWGQKIGLLQVLPCSLMLHRALCNTEMQAKSALTVA